MSSFCVLKMAAKRMLSGLSNQSRKRGDNNLLEFFFLACEPSADFCQDSEFVDSMLIYGKIHKKRY